MSEYQYYNFLAVDQPLDRQQIAELRALSSRAEITPTSFENHYNYGDFRGDPKALVEQYFDAFLYFANWGTRQLMLRMPGQTLDLATARRYCHADSAAVWASDSSVILDLSADDEEGEDWDIDGSGWLASIISVRADLMAGDHRALYLAWLRSVQEEGFEVDDGAFEDDGCTECDEPDGDADDADDEDDPRSDLEPPVPPGLGQLTANLQSLADFLRLDPDLVEAAAQCSSPLVEVDTPTAADLDRWIEAMDLSDKDDVVRRVLRGETSGLQARLLRQCHDAVSAGRDDGAETDTGRRTVGQLVVAASAVRAERERREADHHAAEHARRERAAAQAMERRLADVTDRGDTVWADIETLIASKKPGEYDQAVALLVDLHTLAARNGGTAAFDRRVVELRERHVRKPSLMDRLNRAGLAS